MCLSHPDKKPNRRPGRGYKVVEKDAAGNYRVWDCAWHSGQLYQKQGWQEDPHEGFINTGTTLYPTGFHVGLDKKKAIAIARRHENYDRASSIKHVIAVEVSYRKVVASEMHDSVFGGVKVAREIRFRKELTK